MSPPDAERVELSAAGVAARLGRMGRVRARMGELGVDALLLSHGADLPWLTGYAAMPLERLTLLVVRSEDAVLVVPALEAPRVARAAELFDVRPWAEDEDPVAVVAAHLGLGDGTGRTLAVSDRAWAASVLALQARLPAAAWLTASRVTSPVRAVKDAGELAALRAAASAADRVAGVLQGGGIALVGRRERDVSDDLARRLVAEGHSRVNFAIVGSGPNAASPHHEPGSRLIGPGDTVVCDFGGTWATEGDTGYCSDITRTVVAGADPSSEVAERYAVLLEAQQAATAAASAGVAAADVDAVTRTMITGAGFGAEILHRTGHGIGVEEHEDPYIVAGNHVELRVGNAFSVEPGIYVAGRFGMRLEDIVVIGEDGRPDALNRADRSLVRVDA